MTDHPQRPEYYVLPKDDPDLVVEMLRAAAGLDPQQQPATDPENDPSTPGPT